MQTHEFRVIVYMDAEGKKVEYSGHRFADKDAAREFGEAEGRRIYGKSAVTSVHVIWVKS